jgi:hypothetical protein
MKNRSLSKDSRNISHILESGTNRKNILNSKPHSVEEELTNTQVPSFVRRKKRLVRFAEVSYMKNKTKFFY